MQESLQSYLAEHASFKNDEVVDEFVHQFNVQFQDSLIAVVFYGSCMRTREYDDALLDFYLVVKDYRSAYQIQWHAFLNKILPPNVFFTQIKLNQTIYRAKFAVISQEDLQKRTSCHAFHPYFWARFTQPIAIVFSRNEKDCVWLINIQLQAANTFFKKTIPLLSGDQSSLDVWTNGLGLTYSSELRAESAHRAEVIYNADPAYYDYYYNKLFQLKTIDDNFIIIHKLKWKLRIYYGKYISILRLLKASITFDGGVDYIAWKIHRHTGEEIIVTNKLRKYPWLFCWPLLWRLLLKGKIR